jgi:hypothetical protein
MLGCRAGESADENQGRKADETVKPVWRTPNARLSALNAGYRYGRTIALAAKGRIDDARAERGELQKLAAAAGADDSAGPNSAADLLAVAILVGKARIADA